MNDYGFPDFMEAVEKFDLSNSKNKELREYFDFMYHKYNDLCHVTLGMTPDKIRYLDKLYSLLKNNYFSKLRIDELSNCLVDGQYNEILDLFENEPDKQDAVQKLFEVYMKDCADHFRRHLKTLLEVE